MNAKLFCMETVRYRNLPSLTVAKAPATHPMMDRRSVPRSVETGSTLRVRGNFFGDVTGFVILRISGTSLRSEVTHWSPTSITFNLPDVGVEDDTPARLDVLLTSGQIAKSIRVTLVPREEIEELPSDTAREEASSAPVAPVENAVSESVDGGLTLTPAADPQVTIQ